VSSASTIVGARSTIAGGSEFGSGMSERQRVRIADWIPDASSTVDEGDEHDTYATSSTFSQVDAFTDDTATAYHDAQTTRTSVVQGGRELPRPAPDGPDPDIVLHLVKHWKRCAKSKFDAGEYASAEIYLGKVIKRSEAIQGARFEGRGETVQMLALSLSRQGKWNETHVLLREKFDGREETMEQIATDCRDQRNWEQAEKIYFGKNDYKNAEKWCHQAAREIKANVGMKDPLLFESMYLLAQIYNANGDVEEAEAYRALLPPGFAGMIP
jgi:tetratricopeptide (TPR) repeat protein